MHLNDHQLKEFRDRCLRAVFNGYTIALADEYMSTLAKEVGQDIVPEGVSKASAQHLLALADEALLLRASGGGRKARKTEAKKAEPKVEPKPEPKPEVRPESVKAPEPVVEPKIEAKDETPTVPPPAPEPAKDEPKVEAKTEELPKAPKTEESKSDKSSKKK